MQMFHVMTGLQFQGAIAKKEQYLAEAAADRIQLEVSMKQISDWIHGAEELLDSGYEGLDYDTLNDTISEHKVQTHLHYITYISRSSIE